MDAGLIAWGLAVKRRCGGVPPLWFFTDAGRLPDPLPVLRRLPKGLCGVVFRHDAVPGRLELGKRVAAICRDRRLVMVVAGDARLAARLHAGLHLRGGRRGVLPVAGFFTASVHDHAELTAAKKAGAKLLFISPVFATASHPGGGTLGALRWLSLARRAAPAKPAPLGGIDGARARSLGKFCSVAAGIEAFL